MATNKLGRFLLRPVLAGLLLPQLVWGACTTTSTGWQTENFPGGAEAGTFETTFTGEPLSSSPTEDADMLVNNGLVNAFNDGSVIIGFHTNGEVEARNGGAYANDVTVTFTANDVFSFRVVADVVGETYDVFVSKNGAAEQQLANDYAFRTDWTSSGQVDGWTIHHEGGSAEFCDFAITGDAVEGPAAHAVISGPAVISGGVTIQ